MAEYIEREAVIVFANNHKGSTIDANDIARFPAADVVEVVRCKDCRYWSALDNGSWVCKGRTDGECEMLAVKHHSESPCTEQDHFCSYGKRKDGADNER